MKYTKADRALARIEEAQNQCNGKGYEIFEDLLYLLDQIIVLYQPRTIEENHKGQINEEGFFVFTDYSEDEQNPPYDAEEFCFEEKEVRFAFCSIEKRPKNLIEFVKMERADNKELLKDYVSIEENVDTITIFVDIGGIQKLDS